MATAWKRCPSAAIEEWTTEQINGDLMVIFGGAAKAGQSGGAFVLTGGIQRTQADDQVAQGRQILRGVTGADGRGVLAQGHIAHVVEGFDAPVAATQAL